VEVYSSIRDDYNLVAVKIIVCSDKVEQYYLYIISEDNNALKEWMGIPAVIVKKIDLEVMSKNGILEIFNSLYDN
jgi:hypothetical protein